jgi:hypothetical protein
VIVCAAVVPQPPLLVPELAGAAAAETADLRDACVAAARRLAATTHRWLAVGAGEACETVEAHQSGSFAAYGQDLRVALGPKASLNEPHPDLALPLLTAGWLRAATGDAEIEVIGMVLDEATGPERCVEYGAEIAECGGPEPVALLVVGDGAATHTQRAPGSFDGRAAEYDRRVAEALEDGSSKVLAALDPTLSEELWSAGRVPWQVLAGAIARPSSSRLSYSAAPFGVAYHVAFWTASGPEGTRARP